MRNASVTLTINLNMEVPDAIAEDKIEYLAQKLFSDFLDNEDVNIETFGANGKSLFCKVLKNSINVEQRYTNVDCYIDNKFAEQFEIEDDAQGHGGIGYIGETLDNFIQEEQINFKEYGKEDENDHFVYSIPLGVINGALNECGIKMIETEDWNRIFFADQY